MVLFGTPVAYWMATRDFRGKAILSTAFELPLVLPPAVAGLGLFAAFGRTGMLGSELDALGIQLPFTPAAVVMAMTFVAGPLYLRQAEATFVAVDKDLLAAAQTLGAGPGKVFIRVAVPLASAGLGAGAALGWARALGEFGATIMFAGSLQGVTQTAPIAIYLGFERGAFDEVYGLGAVLIIISAAVLLDGQADRTREAAALRADVTHPLRDFALDAGVEVERHARRRSARPGRARPPCSA